MIWLFVQKYYNENDISFTNKRNYYRVLLIKICKYLQRLVLKACLVHEERSFVFFPGGRQGSTHIDLLWWLFCPIIYQTSFYNRDAESCDSTTTTIRYVAVGWSTSGKSVQVCMEHCLVRYEVSCWHRRVGTTLTGGLAHFAHFTSPLYSLPLRYTIVSNELFQD